MTELKGFAYGKTIRVRAPEGNVFVTINSDGTVFIRVGKAGSIANTLAEAMARLIHLHLGEPQNGLSVARLIDVAKLLEGMSHDRSDQNRWEASSIPDAVAAAIKTFIQEEQGEFV